MDPRTKPIPESIEDTQEQTDRGPLYRVIIHNDDITPMDFVIHILGTIFLVPNPNAEYIMYSAHLNGSAYVQTLPQSEARRRTNRAHFSARLRGHPLKFSMEPEK